MRRLWIKLRGPVLVSAAFFVIYLTTGLFKKLVFPVLPESLYSIAGWGVFILSVVLISRVMIRPLRREVEHLRHAAAQMGAGHLAARAEVIDGALTEPVATAFNDMADRLQTLIEARENLLQTMAHEIRTPLARIRFILDNLESAPDLDSVTLEVRGLDVQITELETLVDEVLTGLTAGQPQEGRTAHSVHELLNAVTRQNVVPSIDIQTEIPDMDLPPIWVCPKGFQRVISNLLSNAIEHAAELVRIEAALDGDVLVVAVEDDGPGIPASDRARALDPFVRLGDVSKRSRNGLGLGLAIANRICLAYGEPIQITQAGLGGARLVTRWPIANL
jgi:signal transduction histidine kinase